MKMRTSIAIALLLGCVAGATLRDVIVVPARAAGAPPGPRYEYKTVKFPVTLGTEPTDYERVMNQFGDKGWRYVGSHESMAAYVLHFEREVASAPAPAPSPAAQEIPPK